LPGMGKCNKRRYKYLHYKLSHYRGSFRPPYCTESAS
jgi:hypothetical protein